MIILCGQMLNLWLTLILGQVEETNVFERISIDDAPVCCFPRPVDAQRHGFHHFVSRCLLGMRFDLTVANGMLSVAGVSVTHSGIKGPPLSSSAP